jgi:hypothetical protein
VRVCSCASNSEREKENGGSKYADEKMRELKGRVLRIRIGFKADTDPENRINPDPNPNFYNSSLIFRKFLSFLN